MIMPTSVVGTCRETAQSIGDYLDGRAPFLKGLRIRFHLSMCPKCRQWLRELRATLAGVDRARQAEIAVQAPPELRQKIERIFQA